MQLESFVFAIEDGVAHITMNAPERGNPIDEVSTAVAVGLVVLLMSATGVLLTYERQIVAYAERQAFTALPRDAPRLDIDTLAERARAALGERVSPVFVNEPAGPVKATAGRGMQALLDPYTGGVIGERVGGLDGYSA